MNWKDFFYKNILSNSLYINDNNIKIILNDENIVTAQIQGSELYNLTLKKDLSEISCDCPFAMKNEYCKHMAALLNYCEKKNNNFNINFDREKFDLKLKTNYKQIDLDEEINYIISNTGCTKGQVKNYIDAEDEYLYTIQRVFDDKTIDYIHRKTGIDENLIQKISEAEEAYLEMAGCIEVESEEQNDYSNVQNVLDPIAKENIDNRNKIKLLINNILKSKNIDKDVKSLNKNNINKYENNIDQILYMLIKSKECYQLRYMSDKLKKDKNFALKAVQINAFSLSYFDNSIKDNDEIVFEAVKSNRLAFEYASDRLRNNRELALLAVKDDGQPYSWIGKSLANDEEIALTAIENYGASMDAAGDSIRDNKEIMLKAIKKDGYNIRYASKRLRDDKDIVITAVKNDDSNLDYASDRLKKDIDVINCLRDEDIRKYYFNKILSNAIFNNDDIIIKLKEDGMQLEYASDEIKDNTKMALIAIENNPNAFKYVSERLKNDKKFVLQALQKDGELYCFVGDNCANDIEVIKVAIKHTNYHIDIIEKIINDGNNDLIYDNEEIVKILVSSTGYYLENASERLKNDYNIVKAAITNDYGDAHGDAIEYASENLRDNEELVTLAILNEPSWYKEDGLSVLEFASERLKNNRKIAITAIKHNKFSKEFINDSLLNELKASGEVK